MINILVLWNLLVFLLYGFDKFASKRGLRRISEKMLLMSAFLMGGAGAFIGMEVFRHKTKHFHFKILVPLFCVMNFLALYFLFGNEYGPLFTSTHIKQLINDFRAMALFKNNF